MRNADSLNINATTEQDKLASAIHDEQIPLDIPTLFKQGINFENTGKVQEAEAIYREVLLQEPSHRLALNQLGNILFAQGRNFHAGELYEDAVKFHPADTMSLVNLGNLLMKTKHPERANELFEAALKIDPAYRPAHAGLSFSLAELGNTERAKKHRAVAFHDHCIVPAPYRGANPPIIVLDMVSTLGGNVRSTEFMSDRVFKRFMMATEFYTDSTPLPEHHILVNSIGDVDVASEALANAEKVLVRSGAPYINHPAAVRATDRCAIAERLTGVEYVVTAKTVLVPRELLMEDKVEHTLSERGFAFPVLLRSPGFHGGDHFTKIDDAASISAALAELPGDDLLVIEYLDARGSDGRARKYRAMMVDGKLYPLHVAISPNWRIHYFSAEMEESAENRAEDDAFLKDMAGVIGERAVKGLDSIQRILGLDYGGIDFGLNDKGEVLLFEANATMAVVIPAADKKWDYRRPAVETIYKAVWTMLRDRAVECLKRKAMVAPAEA